jgi:hypothetical protein
MKIRLSAFNKMWSEPMDIPDNCGFRWDMALTQPISIATKHTPETQPFITRCTFEWNGKYDALTNARIFVLTNITK